MSLSLAKIIRIIYACEHKKLINSVALLVAKDKVIICQLNSKGILLMQEFFKVPASRGLKYSVRSYKESK